MKKIVWITMITTIIIVSYFLFEPIMTYTSGWNSFPNINTLKPIVTHQDSTSKKADNILNEMFTHLKAPGFSVAVGMNGKVIWSNAIGYKDIKNDKKLSRDTKFRIGSTSKAVTSLGIGLLLQDGKLNLNSRVGEFVPYTNDPLSELTLKQLASHTSGIRNYSVCLCFPIWEHLNNDEYTTVQESVGIFSNSTLLFPSGTDFSYSSYNYTLISAMLEGASGKDFLNFMKEDVFNPLGLDHIEGERSSMHTKNISKFYDVEENQYKETFEVNNSNKWAGGGFVSTPVDLVKLGNALLNNQLLDKKTTETILKPVLLNNGEINKQNYAIGWRKGFTDEIFDNNQKVQIIHHAGTAAGSTSVFILFPEYNMSISILMNRSGTTSELFTYSYKLAKTFITKN
ncbi:serine hydrolase domain-containing protein [Aquimarina sp. MMG016]|uniref:serine hydrolase domain-containing protein n=1 Tax=Aquimarina sp. MMG016 TaxID=2822690 RepID=UPI001B3A72FD|nr:serine hydrolase domain-containing protein [Aquimarina sp. MMG016]MBQ4818953.1 beta-lactamase family protein [Aquimarina sp. MMG016]